MHRPLNEAHLALDTALAPRARPVVFGLGVENHTFPAHTLPKRGGGRYSEREKRAMRKRMVAQDERGRCIVTI